MNIHVVSPGQTLYAIGREYGVEPGILARINGLTEPYRLCVGQSLLILKPTGLYRVLPGDTAFQIAQEFSLTTRELYRLNPGLAARARLYPGEVLITGIAESPARAAFVMGYAYPWVDAQVLKGILPYANALAPFTYGFREDGALVAPDDEALLSLAREAGTATLLHLSTLTEQGNFSSERARAVLQNTEASNRLIENTARTMLEKGFSGVDVDFEYLGRELKEAYADFLWELGARVRENGGYLMAALAPKTSDDQPGTLYEGHDYKKVGAACDKVLLMTYEWGYTYGPPMAVAPLESVRRVAEYALTRIPAEKILLGFPNYAYDWTLPYEAGLTRAVVIGNEAAPTLAFNMGSEIQFDAAAQTPWFSYTALDGAVHEVWFEDARSSLAKFQLAEELGLQGLGYWNFMRPFTANFALLNARYSLD